MNAIQRWFISCDYGHPDAESVEGMRLLVPEDEQWCKAADVATLEAILAEKQAKHDAIVDGLRKQVERLQRMVSEESTTNEHYLEECMNIGHKL